PVYTPFFNRLGVRPQEAKIMDPSIPIGLGALYAAIQYLLGRSALHDLRQVDPAYYDGLDARPGTSARNSVGVLTILLEERPVEASYPPAVRRKIRVARWLLLLSPVVLLGILAAIFLA